MHDHHIVDMAQDLVNAGLIPAEKLEEAKAALQKHWEDKIALVWGTVDVIERAKEQNIEVDEDKARDILQSMLRHHDCNYGITWDTIDANL